jgi:hypothetical protein
LVHAENLSNDEKQEIFFLSQNLIEPYGTIVQDYIKDTQSQVTLGSLLSSAFCFFPVNVNDIVSVIKHDDK